MIEPGAIDTLRELQKAIDFALRAPTPYLMADTQFRPDGTRIQSVHLESFFIIRHYTEADLLPAEGNQQ
jgi:hypothetical protein